MGYLTVAYIGSVKPYIKAGINAFEIQVCSGSRWISAVVKIMQVGPAWVVNGNVRRVNGKRIPNIGLLVAVITEILPDPRNRDLMVVP